MPSQPDALERDTIYTLLSDRARRYLLRCLRVVDQLTASEAADRIAEWRRETSTARSVDRDTVAIQLVHNHLPRLDHYDVVDYDHASGEIVPGPNFADLEPFVSRLDAATDP